MLVGRIITQYRNANLIPENDQQTLDFLGIRRQCMEWAAAIVIQSGGTPKLQCTSRCEPQDFRAGMLLLQNDHGHAMIIVDIYWNEHANPTMFRVAEANYQLGYWSNPNGQVPWARQVQLRASAVKWDTKAIHVTSCEGR